MNSEHNIQEKKNVAMSSVIASLFLTIGKVLVGVTTGSLGIISEAAHSGLDFVAALITYFAVSVSDKPADEEHHYGHAKIENFSAFIESILLFITCGWIIREAVNRLLFHEVPLEINVWSFAILVISIIVDFSRSRALKRVAKKYNSQALEADALHFTSDIFSSLVVLLGLVFVKFGMAYADPLAALIVAIIVIVASYRLARQTVDALLDKAPKGIDKKITDEIMNTPRVIGIHRLRLREAGGKIHGDFHLVLERGISFTDGHRIATSVEEKLTKYGNDILVHFEPEVGWEELNITIEETKKTVEQIMVNNQSVFKDFHEITVTEVNSIMSVLLHVVLPRGTSVKQARECCNNIEQDIRNERPQVKVLFQIEPCDSECNDCVEKCSEAE